LTLVWDYRWTREFEFAALNSKEPRQCEALSILRRLPFSDSPLNAATIIEGARTDLRDRNALCPLAIKDIIVTQRPGATESLRVAVVLLRTLKTHPNFVASSPFQMAVSQRFAVKR
jgi:hypothetical protein